MKKEVCKWGMFVINVDELVDFVKSSISNEYEDVDVTLKGDYRISISSDEINLAVNCFSYMEDELVDLYGIYANERAIEVDGTNDLYNVDLMLDSCTFLISNNEVYSKSLKSIPPYKVKSKLTKPSLLKGVGEALEDILKDTDISCSFDSIVSSLNCYKPLKVRGTDNKFLCPIGIECGSEDVINMLIEELDSVDHCKVNGDAMKYQLGCNVGYFGEDKENVSEVMVYVIVEIV